MANQYSHPEDDMSGKLRLLNACYNPYFQWQYHRARKDHVDQFDKSIRAGEHYYRLRMGGSYSNDLKLSQESMERFLYAIFAPGPNWEDNAQRTIDDEMEKVRKIMDRMRSGQP